MSKDIIKIRKYVNTNYKIDSSKLSEDDVIKLANFYILALEVGGNPRFAKSDKEELGL